MSGYFEVFKGKTWKTVTEGSNDLPSLIVYLVLTDNNIENKKRKTKTIETGPTPMS